MIREARRTVRELVARYRFEPTLRDVWVEGPKDAAIYAWYLQPHAELPLAILSAEYIDADGEDLTRRGCENNSRGRVVALAIELERTLGPTGCRVTCVVDRDLAGVFQDLPANPYLLVTDGASVEVYAFQIETLDKFVRVNCCDERGCGEARLGALRVVLENLFVVRVALRQLGLQIPSVSCAKDLQEGANGEPQLDLGGYVSRYLNRSGRDVDRSRLEAQLPAARTLCFEAGVTPIHGRDLTHVLHWIAKRRSAGAGFRSEDALARALLGCIERTQLDAAPMLRRLQLRLAA